MIYSYQRTINLEDREVTKKIFICCDDTSSSVLVSRNVFASLKFFKDLQASHMLKVAVLPEMSVPVITVDPAEKTFDVTGIVNIFYDKLRACGDNLGAANALSTKFAQIVAQKLNGDSKRASLIVTCSRLQYDWEHSGKIKEAFALDAADYDNDLRAETVAVMNTINSEFTNVFSALDIKNNETVFQSSCTDKFFIEIPLVQELTADDKSISDLVPGMSEICKPYSDDIASTPKYKRVYADNKAILHDIEGDRSHNRMEPYENEEEYFNALDKWVQFNMREQYGTTNGNVIDTVSQLYLQELIARLYMLHWRHCPDVPDEIDDSIGDDSAEAFGRYIFKDKENRTNAVIILNDYLKEAAAELGYKVYLYAVIQIARWGARKPTAIVFDDYADEFDLGLGMVNKKLGDISKYVVVKSGDCDSKLIGLIYEDKQVRDAEAGIEYNTLPVGVILNKMIAPSEDSGADERIDVMEYYNFIDLIPEIKSGDLKVDGINYVDGNWDVDDSAKDFSQATVTELVNIYNQTKNSVLKFPFHRSKELMDLLTSTRRDVAGVQQSLFTIFNMRISDSQLVKHAGQAIFGSYMDILNIVADQSNVLNSTIAVVEYGIMNSLLPVVYEVAKAGTPKDIEDVFSIWDRAMINYQGLPDLKSENATATAIKTKPVTAFGDVKSKLDAKEGNTEFTNKSEEKVNSIAIPEKTRSAVDNTIPKVEVVKSTSEDLDDWFKIVPDDAPLTKILVGDSVVGYAFVERVQPDGATKPFNSYTIMSDPGDHKVLDDTGVNFYKVIAFVLHTISLRKSGSVTRQVYFSDAQQLNLFKRRVIDLSKI